MTDPRELMQDLWTTAAPATFERWDEILRNGGKQKHKLACPRCKQTSTYELEAIDAEEQRHILRFLAENTLTKPKDDGPPKLSSSITEATDEELEAMLAGPPSDEWEEFQTWRKTHKLKTEVGAGKQSARRSKSPSPETGTP